VSISSNDNNLLNSYSRPSPQQYIVMQYLNMGRRILHTLLQPDDIDLILFLKKLKQQEYYLKFFYISFNVVDFSPYNSNGPVPLGVK